MTALHRPSIKGTELLFQVNHRALLWKMTYKDSGFEVHRPSIKGTELQFQVIKAIILIIKEAGLYAPNT